MADFLKQNTNGGSTTAVIHPNFQPGAGHLRSKTTEAKFSGMDAEAVIHPNFQPEADGNQQAQLRNGIRDVDVGAEMLLPDTANRALGGTAGPGGSTFSTGADGLGLFGNEADALTKGGQEGEEVGINDAPPVFKPRSNWDVICDVGTSLKQPTDLRANGAVHQDTPMDTHPNDNLLGYPGAGSEALTKSGTIPGDTYIPGDMYQGYRYHLE